MKKKFSSFDFDDFFAFLGLFFVGLGFWAVFLAMIQAFFLPILLIYPLVAILFLGWILSKKTHSFKPNWEVTLLLFFSLTFVLFFSLGTTPSIFSGRDQGSYSQAAIELSKNHRLTFSFPASEEFFRIYGSGQALNFPGFNYTQDGKLITQFPLGYTTWLGFFYSLFGLSGLVLANGLLFLLFACSIFFLSKKYLPTPSAWAVFFLVLTAFPFGWFFKLTLSENLALAFFWFGVLELIEFLEKKKSWQLVASLSSFIFLAFSRIEILAIIVIIFAILLRKYTRQELFKKILTRKKLILLGTGLFLYLATFYVNQQFFISFLKGFFKSFSSLEKSPGTTSYFPDFFYIIKVFMIYGLATFLVGGFLGLITLFQKKKYSFTIPYLIALPAFIYVFHPSISLDHPWMLRRFLFTVIPASILYTVLLLDNFFKKRFFFWIAFSLLLISNLTISISYFSTSENKDLLPQIENLSQDFQSSDLILIDRLATGSGFSMMSGPMEFIYHKQAVYFFNPEDLKKIDLSRFSAVYLIIPDENLGLYQKSSIFSKLEVLSDYQIENSFLEIPADKRSQLKNLAITLPKNKQATATGKIYRYNK